MSKSICTACLAEDDPEPKVAQSRGLCPKHYQRAVRAGAFAGGKKAEPCPKCIAEKLREIRPVYVRGVCRPHYQRGLKTGELGRVYAPKGSNDLCVECLEEGVETKAHARGLCPSHYGLFWRKSDEASDLFRQDLPEACAFDDCDGPPDGTGLCAGHRRQLERGKPLTPLRSYVSRVGTCLPDHCPFPVMNGGLCRTHYDRKRSGELDWDRPIRPKAENGDGHLSEDGYYFVTVNGRSVAEHRHLMELLLGRALLPGENVHHLNGNRSDNRINGQLHWLNGKLRSGNLELWSTKQPAGQEIGPKLDWAMEMQEEYELYLTDEYLEKMAAILERSGYMMERAA